MVILGPPSGGSITFPGESRGEIRLATDEEGLPIPRRDPPPRLGPLGRIIYNFIIFIMLTAS